MCFSHVLRAAKEPIELDELQANAVAARIELDLRIGAAFTRLQSLQLQPLTPILANQTISYGTLSCLVFGMPISDFYRLLPIPDFGVRG